MALELIQPDGLPVPESYTHVVVATGTRTVYIAGQVAEDADDNLVAPGDLAGQAQQAFANLGRALAAAGARPDQVARITIYVVDHRPEYLSVIAPARIALFGDHLPADTYLGVQSLAEAGRLIEVEAIAVLD
jgi:enamine deaminase RidA (YjgF/YER057c/UK114 family)